MSKLLCRNEEDYNELKESICGRWFISNPIEYPCICIYERNESSTGLDFFTGEFIYLDDFEEFIPNGNADGVGV